MSYQAPLIPRSFIWRRAHSFTGLWLVLFLIEHLLVNSQATLLLGEDGSGFIRAVNSIKDLPFLPVIEVGLLGIPFLIHGIWGVRYLMSAKYNSLSGDGSTPALPSFPRNQAYTWQRITSWILLFGIVAHVVHMRFIEYPVSARVGTKDSYMVRVNSDEGLYTLAARLGFQIYNKKQVQNALKQIKSTLHLQSNSIAMTSSGEIAAQLQQEKENWIRTLEKLKLQENQVVTISDSFGLAELLVVREAFKSPIMIFLYTGLVLAACFHGFNGLWTFMISWGVTLSERSQNQMRKLATGLTVLIAFLGLASIWGTYWINLFN